MSKRKYQTFKPCAATGYIQEGGNILHHVKTRGSGGVDDLFNMMPLTTEMHHLVHQVGLNRFAETYPGVKDWLLENGWEFDETIGRWMHS